MKRLKQFLKWMKGNKRYYLVASLILVSLQYFRTLTPLFIQHTIDSILLGEESNLPVFIQNIIVMQVLRNYTNLLDNHV